MKRRLSLAVVAGAVQFFCVAMAQAQAQVLPPPPPPPLPGVVFEGTTFDVTGAGVLDLGDLDVLLGPFRRAFDNGRQSLAVELTLDPAGAVVACSTQGAQRLDEAGNALCARALAHGRFTRADFIVIRYEQATYRMTVNMSNDRAVPEQPQFYTSTSFPLERTAVTFAPYSIPPEEERLLLSDLRLISLTYPAVALRNAIEARVEVLLTFGESGRVATCRPLYSSNTARMAYETCREARTGLRLRNPPDDRALAFAAKWVLAE